MQRFRAWAKVRAPAAFAAGMLCAAAAVVLALQFLPRTPPAVPMLMPAPVVALAPGATVGFEPGGSLPADARPLDWVATGRWQADADGGLTHEWPGLALFARFDGDGVLIDMDDAVNRYRVTVDGAAVAQLTRLGAGVLRIAGLGPGIHDLRLDRLSEAWEPARIRALAVPPGVEPEDPPPLPQRRIDIYGDSDSVGFGNLHDGRDCPGDDIFLTTDTTAAWPALLAARFDATAAVMARSGIGLIRNYGGAAPGQAMVALHDRVLPSVASTTIGDMDPPWITIVALGDNDVSTPVTPDDIWPDTSALIADFDHNIDAFLNGLWAAAPGRPILLVLFADAGRATHGVQAAAVARLAATDAPVATVMVPELARTGCNWHPSAADHRLMADTIAAAVDTLIATTRPEAP